MRSKRIFNDQVKLDKNIKYEDVLKNTKSRDHKDCYEKGESCLKILPEAFYIDATLISANEVVNQIIDYIR